MANWTSNEYVNALLVGTRYLNGHITYFFKDNLGDSIAWNDIEKDAYRNAAISWMKVANVTFNEESLETTADWWEDLNFIADQSDLAGHSLPGNMGFQYGSPSIIDVTLNPPHDGGGGYNINGFGWHRTDPNGGLNIGGLAYWTLVHEIGHGLGLDHSWANPAASDPHYFPGADNAGDFGDNGLNDKLYTVMSYLQGSNLKPLTAELGSNDYGLVAGPMAFDIAAIQALYGPNQFTNSGNNTYVLPEGNAEGTYWTCIWDTGGIDTITYAGLQNATIDLRPATLLNEAGGGGFLSRVNEVLGGYTIAGDFTNFLPDVGGTTGVIIENASGGSGNDSITGNGAANQLLGNNGDDTLIGGAGGDTLSGGAGTDTASYAGATAAVVALMLTPGSNTGDAAGDTYNSIEWMVGSDHNDILRGDNNANRLDGGEGNDSLDGVGGSDTIVGGNGSDTSGYFAAAAAVLVDLAIVGAQNTVGDGTDELISIENLYGSTFNDTLRGDGGANDIRADSGNDQIFGRNGNDTMFGWLGNDQLLGEVGNDQLFGEQNNDTLTGGVGLDTVNGGDGDDIMFATHDDGNDTYTGGNGFDILDFSQVNGVVQINQLAGTVTGSAGNDTLTDVIEQIKGTAFNDVLSGGHGINVLDGEGGADQFFGNNGEDLMRGGTGDDTFFFSTNDGNDTLLGGDGFDILDYSTLGGVVQVNQLAGTTTGTANNDTLSDVFEMVIGTAFGDVLSGGHGINSLKGNDGADQIFANNGDDYMSGGSGNDTLTGGVGNDTQDVRNGEGIDTWLDFTAGGTEDTITLTHYSGLGVSNFSQLQASGRLSTVSGHAELALNGGDRIIFNNVASHLSLTAADFIF